MKRVALCCVLVAVFSVTLVPPADAGGEKDLYGHWSGFAFFYEGEWRERTEGIVFLPNGLAITHKDAFSYSIDGDKISMESETAKISGTFTYANGVLYLVGTVQVLDRPAAHFKRVYVRGASSGK